MHAIAKLILLHSYYFGTEKDFWRCSKVIKQKYIWYMFQRIIVKNKRQILKYQYM